MTEKHETTLAGGYHVKVETWTEDGAEHADCWVTSPGGGHTNSLALLEDMGQFDDGPKISNAALQAARRFAEKHGY